MIFKRKISFCLILLLQNWAWAQQGIISGTVTDADFQDPVPFANVVVKGTEQGGTTDFDGHYELVLEAGTYTLSFSFLGYKTIEVTDVVVQPNAAVEINTVLEVLAEGLDEVVVSVSARQNTESAVLTFQKKSASLLDGLSSESFKKTGASDIASAVKSVPGVSVEGGKYVFVRGLGDRYTKSILNGVDIPGLDPDRNTIQMDLFPTNILDNVLVIKSATADMPADFTGGIVNIITKEFPTQKSWSVSLNTSYTPGMHLNKNAVSFAGSGTDFLGFDNGSRTIPVNPNQNYAPSEVINSPLQTEITKKFNPTLAGDRSTQMPNISFSVSGGNQYDVGNNGQKLGVFGSLSYKNNYSFFEGAQDNSYRKESDKSINELAVYRTQTGDLGSRTVILSGMAGVSYKTTLSKYKFNALHIQNGTANTGKFMQELRFSDFIDLKKDFLEYTQRSVTNMLLSGTHSTNDAEWKLEWKLSPTFSSIQDKDIRTTAFKPNDQGVYTIQQNSRPSRIWRDLKEVNLVGKIDITKKATLFSREAKLMAGGFGSYKVRDFNIYKYEVAIGTLGISSGDANLILAPENVWTTTQTNGNYIDLLSTVVEQGRAFQSKQFNAAGYLSAEASITEKLRAIVGVRFEKFDVLYTGENSSGRIKLINAKVIDRYDFFPSSNFIYALNDVANLRFSYSKTTARPSFKEVSIAEIYDPLSNRTFIGNINLEPTYIDNFDLRFERFGQDNSFLALSGFYKSFTDPIELTYSEADPDNYIPQNLGDAHVFGVELEWRKDLDFLGMPKFRISSNISLIESFQKFAESEKRLRTLGLREGETLEEGRPLQGQSPLLVNTSLNYNNEELGLETGLFYNVQGKTLEVVGTGFFPDVYTQPFHSLNFTCSKNLDKKGNMTLSFKVTNILDEVKQSRFESFNSNQPYFRYRNPGRNFTLGYSLKF